MGDHRNSAALRSKTLTKRPKEKMDSQTSADPIQCANGCGFFGNPSMSDMCSKCYREVSTALKEKEEIKASALAAVAFTESIQKSSSTEQSPAAAPPADPSTPKVEEEELTNTNMECIPCTSKEAEKKEAKEVAAKSDSPPVPPATSEAASEAALEPAKVAELIASDATKEGGSEEEKPKKKVQKNRKRCFECRKKIGLTAMECKCGFVFCNLHRFPDQHKCDFDFKAHDRGNLAKVVLGGGNFSKMQKV